MNSLVEIFWDAMLYN